MGKIGIFEHERTLNEEVMRLELDGWRIIKLHGKLPDALAIKENKIVVVEILKNGEK